MTVISRMMPALIAGFLIASPALAQDSGVDEVTGEALPTGTPDGDGVGEPYTAATHGDWEIRCIRVEEGRPEPCQLYQLLADSNGSPVAEFNIFDLPDGDQVVAGATIITPLDTLLSPQLRLRVDDGQGLRYPFTFCQDIGCFVRIGLTAEDMANFRAGAEAIVTIVPLQAPDQEVNLVTSLRGFTAGFEDLEERTAAAQEAAAE